MKKRSMFALLLFLCVASGSQAKEPGWKQLFNGHSLKGWQHVGAGSFIVEDGLLKTQGGRGMLYLASGPFNDCEIKVVYRMEHANDESGVFIRVPLQPTDPEMAANQGYEVQINNHPELNNEDEYHGTGTLFSMTRPLAQPGKPGGEWNTMVIRIEGLRTQVFVNDKRVTDYTEGQPVPDKKLPNEPNRGLRPDKGWIGLENHSDKDTVSFKTVAIRVLGAEEGYLP